MRACAVDNVIRPNTHSAIPSPLQLSLIYQLTPFELKVFNVVEVTSSALLSDFKLDSAVLNELPPPD